MEWSESINRYFPHMAGCLLPIYCTLPIAHCPTNVYCVCIAQNLPVPKIHIACYPSFKGYCPLPIEYCQLPIASRQWLVSNCAQNPFSFTTAGVNFFLQVWLRFSSSCCWEGSQTAASTPTSHPGTSYFLFEFFFRFFLHIFPQAHNVHLPAEGLWGSEVDPWVEFVSILSEMYIM